MIWTKEAFLYVSQRMNASAPWFVAQNDSHYKIKTAFWLWESGHATKLDQRLGHGLITWSNTWQYTHALTLLCALTCVAVLLEILGLSVSHVRCCVQKDDTKVWLVNNFIRFWRTTGKYWLIKLPVLIHRLLVLTHHTAGADTSPAGTDSSHCQCWHIALLVLTHHTASTDSSHCQCWHINLLVLANRTRSVMQRKPSTCQLRMHSLYSQRAFNTENILQNIWKVSLWSLGLDAGGEDGFVRAGYVREILDRLVAVRIQLIIHRYWASILGIKCAITLRGRTNLKCHESLSTLSCLPLTNPEVTSAFRRSIEWKYRTHLSAHTAAQYQ
jgi:hypothetical protein